MRSVQTQTDFKHTALRHKHAHWVHFASIPSEVTLDGWLEGMASSQGEAVILRGCSRPLATVLKGRGFDLLPVGMEAEIGVEGYIPGKGLRELQKRGLKQGRIMAFNVDEAHLERMRSVWRRSPYARRTMLKKLFRNEQPYHQQGLAFIDRRGQWQAFVTWSHNNSRKRHLEQMVRAEKAPAGAMEALILQLIPLTRAAGYDTLSLGEVPFFFPRGFKPRLRAALIAAAGRLFPRIYNARGLYHFKDKFHPRWQPVYICGKPRVSWLHLLEMAWHSRYVHLAVETYFPFYTLPGRQESL